MKRVLSIVIVIALVFCLTATASAGGNDGQDIKPEVQAAFEKVKGSSAAANTADVRIQDGGAGAQAYGPMLGNALIVSPSDGASFYTGSSVMQKNSYSGLAGYYCSAAWFDSQHNLVAGVPRELIPYNETTETIKWKTVKKLPAGKYTLYTFVDDADYNLIDGDSIDVYLVDKPAPAAPSILSLKRSSATSAKLTWSGVSGAKGFEVYRYGPGDSGFKLVAETSNTAYKSKKLVIGGKYKYKVRAYNYNSNGEKQYGAFSKKTSISIAPYAPSKVKVQRLTKKAAKVTWAAAQGATAYEIYRATSFKGSYVKIATVDAGVTAFIDKPLSKSQGYYYKVQTVTKSGSAKLKSGVSAKTAYLAPLK